MKTLSPLKSIKKYCKENCCAGDQKNWKECTATKCFLYPYNRIGIGNRKKKEKHSSGLSDSTKNMASEKQEQLA